MPALLLQIAGAVALLVWGTYMVKTGILRTFGESLRVCLAKYLKNRFLRFFAGFSLAAVLQSSTAAALLVAGLQAGGLVTTAIALAAVLGADVGSAFMVRVLTLDLSSEVPVLILAGTFLFLRRTNERSGQFGRILLGLAFILMALRMIMEGTLPLRESEELTAAAQWFDASRPLSILLGILLALAFFSSLAVVATTAAFHAAGILSMEAGLWVVLGANIGSALLAILTTSGSSRTARKAPLGNGLFRTIGFVLGAATLGLVPPVKSYFSVLPDGIVLFHLAYNAVVCLFGLLFVGPAARFIEFLLPSKPLPSDGEVELLAEENLLSVKTSLGLAKKEIAKTAEILERYWEDLRRMLSINPPAGELLLMESRRKLLERRCRAVSVYLAAVVRLGLTAEESRSWDRVSTLSDSLGFAVSVCGQIFKTVRKNKWRDSRFFSSPGLTELLATHDEVANMLRELEELISQNGNKEVLVHMLAKEEQALSGKDFELVVRHMDRVSSGVSESVETSALHVELLALYRRVAAILMNAARSA